MLMTDDLHQFLVPGSKHVGCAFLHPAIKGANNASQLVLSSTHILVVRNILDFSSTTQTEHNDCSLLMKHTSSP